MIHKLHPRKIATFVSFNLLVMFCWAVLAGAQTWTSTGSLGTARYTGYNLIYGTVLRTGKVLVAGGNGPVCCYAVIGSAELYDPVAGTFSPTGSLNFPRSGYGSTLLLNGMALYVGGGGGGSSAELYDPTSGTFSTTGSMATPRNAFGLAFLSTGPSRGKVLVVGGDNGGNCVAPSAELYDPTSGTFSTTGNTIEPCREGSSATTLRNGMVLVAGGNGGPPASFAVLQSAELYDPNSGIFTATGSMTVPRNGHTATLLANGKVLIAGGGTNTSGGSGVTNSAELYDPASGTFSPTGSMATARSGHGAVALSKGQVEPGKAAVPRPTDQVLMIGGSNGPFTATAELYDRVTGTFSSAGSMSLARSGFWAALLSNGNVLVAGGAANSPPFTLAELFTP